MEMVKARAYGQAASAAQQKAAWYTLHTVLKNVLLLLAPITPFIPEHVWLQLYSTKSIHAQRFPTAPWPKNYRRYTEKLLAFNQEVWKVKKEKNLALRDPIELNVPKALTAFKNDLTRMHSLTLKQ